MLALCVCCSSYLIFIPYMQGDGVCFRCLHPTKTHLLHSDMDWGRSIHVPAQSFSEMGRGSTQEPPCRLFDMSIFSALLSQYGITFDQICMVLLHQNLPQSKDVESIPRTEFHDGSTIFSCQTLLDCLCTFDAFHISNSIRYF